MPTRFLINQCQIITFLILKYDIIENSRIELRGIVLPVQVGGLLGGGGGGDKGYVAPPPLKLLGGQGLAPRPPSSYAYVGIACPVLLSAAWKSHAFFLRRHLTIMQPKISGTVLFVGNRLISGVAYVTKICSRSHFLLIRVCMHQNVCLCK